MKTENSTCAVDSIEKTLSLFDCCGIECWLNPSVLWLLDLFHTKMLLSVAFDLRL